LEYLEDRVAPTDLFVCGPAANAGRTKGMLAKGLTPILNVSDIQQSFAWFERLGWKKGWDWGTPPTFGGVCSGKCEIFLCQGGQGGRGKGPLPMTSGLAGAQEADKGVWMSIWVDDVDAVHQHCLEEGLEVTWPPTDEPWGVREMHVRHPDGHVFRISQGIECAE
jgi:catechol 2,3-dioxygenase-like lactoylglutathione lyase family enzyme